MVTDSPDCLSIGLLLGTSVFCVLVFLFFHFLVVGSVRYIKLTRVRFWMHVKMASRIVLSKLPEVYGVCETRAENRPHAECWTSRRTGAESRRRTPGSRRGRPSGRREWWCACRSRTAPSRRSRTCTRPGRRLCGASVTASCLRRMYRAFLQQRLSIASKPHKNAETSFSTRSNGPDSPAEKYDLCDFRNQTKKFSDTGYPSSDISCLRSGLKFLLRFEYPR